MPPPAPPRAVTVHYYPKKPRRSGVHAVPRRAPTVETVLTELPEEAEPRRRHTLTDERPDPVEQALAQFEAALALDPDDLAALVYRAEVRLARKKPAKAVEDLERALAVGAPGDPFVARAKKLLTLARSQRAG